MGFPSNNQYRADHCSPGQYLQAQKQFVPGGMAFSFNTMQPFFAQAQLPYNQAQFNNTLPQSIQPLQHIMVSSPQPSHQHQLGAMQRRLMQCQKEQTEIIDVDHQHIPTSWKFHKDVGTSSEDLLNYHTQTPGSQSSPDFNYISGIYLQQAPVICHSNKIKELTLSQQVRNSKGHVCDVLDAEENEKKQVSFSESENDKFTCKTDNEDDEMKEMIDKSMQDSLFICRVDKGVNLRFIYVM
ncbi:unnamed protein product [Acanthoscelides obtectus]|uniref:Uncharacterized protein n=1 Tax=Acanthoscelides obtectus TaxID=200917 RepID=A0A9P0L5S7_ACAOB|nr:unnamed protein product [Acanthoscelides obtectus]CAK1624054.1 hypothetical protein AOBTE_LOCUS2311 [Acanthoscelides obtectus]